MTNWRNIVLKYRSAAWLLVSALLLLTILPAHYHMQHELTDDAMHHEHVVDFHTTIHSADSEHHADDHDSISTTPDGMVKKVGTVLLPFVLFALLISFIFLPVYRQLIRLGYRIIGPKQSYPHFSPPLRAPPF